MSQWNRVFTVYCHVQYIGIYLKTNPLNNQNWSAHPIRSAQCSIFPTEMWMCESVILPCGMLPLEEVMLTIACWYLLQWLFEMEFAEFIRTAQVEGVTLYQANQLPIKGTLCVTGHHLILSSRDNHIEELWVYFLFDLLNWFHLACVVKLSCVVKNMKQVSNSIW